jgi:hypothetical protein
MGGPAEADAWVTTWCRRRVARWAMPDGGIWSATKSHLQPTPLRSVSEDHSSLDQSTRSPPQVSMLARKSRPSSTPLRTVLSPSRHCTSRRGIFTRVAFGELVRPAYRLPIGLKEFSNLSRIDGKIPRDLLDGEAQLGERVKRRALDWPPNSLRECVLPQAIQPVSIVQHD